jgi:hypothetical protein
VVRLREVDPFALNLAEEKTNKSKNGKDKPWAGTLNLSIGDHAE